MPQEGSKGNHHQEKIKSKKELLDEIDLSGMEEWNGDEQKDAQKLVTGYASIFDMSDVDLGKSS